MKFTRTWSLDKTNKLKKLFKKGLTYTQIAHELGSNRSAIAGKLSRLGIRRTPHDYRLSHRKTLQQMEHRRSISMFGDEDKIGAFKHCKWLMVKTDSAMNQCKRVPLLLFARII